MVCLQFALANAALRTTAFAVAIFNIMFCPRFPLLWFALPLVVESIAELNVDLPWAVPVEAAESHTIVELHTTVRDIQSVERRRESFAKLLAQGEIEGCVLGKIIPRIGLVWKAVSVFRWS